MEIGRVTATGKPVVAGVRDHHHQHEGAQLRTIQAKRHGNRPRDQSHRYDDEDAQQGHAAEIRGRHPRRDEQIEDEARDEGVEDDEGQGPDVRTQNAGEHEADPGDREDGQDVRREDGEEQVHVCSERALETARLSGPTGGSPKAPGCKAPGERGSARVGGRPTYSDHPLVSAPSGLPE